MKSSYSLVSSISFDDDSSISSLNTLKRTSSLSPSGHPPPPPPIPSASINNETFLRFKYLQEREKQLRKRLIQRPFDQRALIEYAEVTYEQKNFLVSCKIIKRIIAIGETSGYWYLKLGKCCFRRWLIYALPAGLIILSFCFSLLTYSINVFFRS